MKKSTMFRSLLMSGLSMLLCVSMLMGSTFAWFTDSVESGVNTIVAGNLDVELSYLDGKNAAGNDNWTSVKDTTVLFQPAGGLWEPGVMVYETFKVTNAGSLALKYQLGLNVGDYEKANLANVLKVAVIEGTSIPADRNAALALNYQPFASFAKSGKLESETNAFYTVVIYWEPSDNDNAYMNAKIDLGISLFATQVESEGDSFGSDYDADAPIVSAPVARPENAAALNIKGAEDVIIGLPADVVENLPTGVTEIGLSVSEPVVDATAKTITFASIELVDQDGKVIDLTSNTTPITVSLPLPEGAPFAEGDTVVIYHDGEYVATAIVDANGNISYEVAHLCEVSVGAVEAPAEKDGVVEIANVAQLIAFAQSVNAGNTYAGKTVVLTADIDLNNVAWTPIGRIGTTSTDFTYAFKGTFDGQNHTVYNLEVSNDGWAGLFGLAYQANIKNLKLDGVTLNSSRMTGSVVGQLYGSLDNCHVENANIMVVPNAVGNSYDNGDKVGGIVGWIGDNGNNRTLSNCSATNVKLSAYRDVGGIAGYVASSTVVSGNKASNVTITVDQTTNHYGEKDTNAGAIIGRDNGANVDDTNTTSEINISETYYKNGLKIKADGEGNVILAGVAENYNSDTITVPEIVTALGSKALNGNTTIKTVILPLSVTDFGGTPNENGTGASGGFFYGSAVEKVVLPEGITEIPAAMFNGARSLKEVNIPSSVNTIGINAFAYTGIEKLTVPATVTNIGYGAFRGMANLTSVIIEGNVNIPVYAFRTCTNLRTVIIKGSDVTFSNGSMIFTHYDTGDGRGITVYVANETVKERLIAADSAATTYGGYDILIISAIPEDKELSDILTDGADSVYVPADKYATFPSNKVSEGDVIVCAPGTVFEGTSSLNVSGATVIGATFKNENGIAVTQTISGTFKDCVFEGYEALRWCYSTAGDTVVFENCVIKTDFRGVHFDDMKGDVVFRNCEINGFNAFGGTGTVTFEGCTFGYDESYYNGLNMYCNTVLKNCKFEYRSNKSNFIDFEAAGKSLTIENCTATMNGEEASILDFVGGTYKSQTTIIVDGAQVINSDSALKAAIEANVSKILLANGNYSVRFTNNTDFNVDNMTIVGMGDNVNLSVSSSEAWYGRVQGDNVTFENVNFTSSVGATGKATYNNCTFADWTICASSNQKETYFNGCTINGCLNTSTDFSAGNTYVKDSTVAKAEYSGNATMNFENCTIGTLISWNMKTVLTSCTVETLDDSHMTSNTIVVNP